MCEMVSFRVERELGSNPKQILPDMKCKIHFYTCVQLLLSSVQYEAQVDFESRMAR